MHVRRT